LAVTGLRIFTGSGMALGLADDVFLHELPHQAQILLLEIHADGSLDPKLECRRSTSTTSTSASGNAPLTRSTAASASSFDDFDPSANMIVLPVKPDAST
jgi:hypothetical protein